MPESRGICRLEQHLPGSGAMLHVEKADLDDDILRMQMTMGYFKQPAGGREEESRWRVPTPSRYMKEGALVFTCRRTLLLRTHRWADLTRYCT